MNAKAATCPSNELLADYGLGKLDNAGTETIYQHLETCIDCRSVVASLSGDSFVNRLIAAQAQPGDTQSHVHLSPERTFVPDESIANVVDNAETPTPTANLRAVTRRQLSAGAPSLANVPPELADHPDYELLKELGRGGMGVVYLARNRIMDRLEVLKVVNKALMNRPGARDRFQQEIRQPRNSRIPTSWRRTACCGPATCWSSPWSMCADKT